MELGQTSFRISHLVIIIAGTLSLALGLTVIYGWHAHNLTILQVRPDYVAMVYNTASCFVLSGLGLLAWARGKRRWVLVGAMVAVFAILNLIEAILHIDLGVENFFFTHYLAVQTVHPGDMAPNTAVCFTLMGVAFLLLSQPGRDRWGSQTLVFLGSGVTALSVVALFGYLLGITCAYGWGHATRMAFHTALGLVVLGVATITAGWQASKAAGTKIQPWLSAATGLSAFTISLLLGQAIVAHRQCEPGATIPLETAGGAVLVVGLLMSSLLALAVHFTQKARFFLGVSQAAGRELQEEMEVRRFTEKALKESEHQYRRIVETAQEGIWMIDAANLTSFVNPKMAEMLGYPVAEMLGVPVFAFLDDEGRAIAAAKLQCRRQGISEHYEFKFTRKDGADLWGLVSVCPLLDHEGRYQGALAMVTDITQRREAFHQLRRTLRGTVTALASITESRDPYTAGHQRRVAQLAGAIAQELGFSPESLEGIQVMGFLHDIGKIAVPAEILSKPGKISDYEFGLVKTHPQVGHDILQGIEFPWPVAQAVLQHHERLDGSGYPAGLTGTEIIPEATILAVADVVEASASHRPYRPALGIDQALEIVSRHHGSLYDPQIVDVCVRLFTKKGFRFQ